MELSFDSFSSLHDLDTLSTCPLVVDDTRRDIGARLAWHEKKTVNTLHGCSGMKGAFLSKWERKEEKESPEIERICMKIPWFFSIICERKIATITTLELAGGICINPRHDGRYRAVLSVSLRMVCILRDRIAKSLALLVLGPDLRRRGANERSVSIRCQGYIGDFVLGCHAKDMVVLCFEKLMCCEPGCYNKTLCEATGLDYNNGQYLDHPSTKLVKAELAKTATNEALVQKTIVLKTSVPMA
ncbi:hypothetical protein Tco_0821929 [Tanacetum coccineum]|uniref:Uncharacterized protein n=1 Tax=Tanacetum coccineum TaxID=301880 RepID=A0ABQ5ADL6_9ASTR